MTVRVKCIMCGRIHNTGKRVKHMEMAGGRVALVVEQMRVGTGYAAYLKVGDHSLEINAFEPKYIVAAFAEALDEAIKAYASECVGEALRDDE